jgi:glycerol-3-phosphate acyltransferase PlsX
MQKSQRTLRPVLIAQNRASRTGFALIVVSMLAARWFMRGKSKNNGIIPCHIGIDLLGSDVSPDRLLQEILFFCKDLSPSVSLTLFGTAELFRRVIPPVGHVFFQVVKEMITMEDAPLTAVRRKKDSSLCIGIRLLKEGHLQAFISAGNTGALMGCARLQLPALLHVERPALLTLLPTRQKEIAVLDVGANTSYKAQHLIQFAAMGVSYQRSRGIKIPTVGLLNIGSEAKKGTPELQRVYNQLLTGSKKSSSLYAFAGNVEGRDVFHGEIDVLVTDGFTGNVFLKTAEGIAGVILEELESSPLEDCSPHMKGILAELRQRLHYAEYPGALLCGVDGIVIKCHGHSGPQSFIRSITTATRLVQHSFLDQIREELKKKT